MDLIPLLILPLVGGYAFSIIWIASLYHSSRETGHRLYFRSVFYAVILIICAFLIHIILFDTTSYKTFLLFVDQILGGKNTLEIWGESSKIVILLLPYFLGPLLGHLINMNWLNHIPCFTDTFKLGEFNKKWKTIILRSAIANNDFELLLLASFENEFPVMFTLNSGKVYIGRVVRAPNPIEQRRAIRIAPLISGYRDQETHQLEITTDYYEIISELEKVPEDRKDYLKHLSQEDFEVVFPSDSVSSCHLFDLETYINHFNSNSE